MNAYRIPTPLEWTRLTERQRALWAILFTTMPLAPTRHVWACN